MSECVTSWDDIMPHAVTQAVQPALTNGETMEPTPPPSQSLPPLVVNSSDFPHRAHSEPTLHPTPNPRQSPHRSQSVDSVDENFQGSPADLAKSVAAEPSVYPPKYEFHKLMQSAVAEHEREVAELHRLLDARTVKSWKEAPRDDDWRRELLHKTTAGSLTNDGSMMPEANSEARRPVDGFTLAASATTLVQTDSIQSAKSEIDRSSEADFVQSASLISNATTTHKMSLLTPISESTVLTAKTQTRPRVSFGCGLNVPDGKDGEDEGDTQRRTSQNTDKLLGPKHHNSVLDPLSTDNGPVRSLNWSTGSHQPLRPLGSVNDHSSESANVSLEVGRSSDARFTTTSRTTNLIRKTGHRAAQAGQFELRPDWEEYLEGNDEEKGHSHHLDRRANNVNFRSRSMFSGLHAVPSHIDLPRLIHKFDCLDRFVSYPNSAQRIVWDLLGAAFLILDVLLIPLEAFQQEESFESVVAINWISLNFWTLDMFSSLFVGYPAGGKTEMRFYKVLLRYCRTWLPIDLTVVGVEWAFVIMNSKSDLATLGSAMRVLRLLRLLRLVRMLKMSRIVSHLSDLFTSEYTSIIANICQLVVVLLVINHAVACLWYWLGTKDEDDYPTWVESFGFEDGSFPWLYFTSMHWSLCQFTPGSMDLQPKNVKERSYNVCVLVFGLLVFSGFVSSITNHLMRLKALVNDQSQQFWQLRCYLKQRGASQVLCARIYRHVEFVLKQQVDAIPEHSVKLMQYVSTDLKNELKFGTWQDSVLSHLFFYYLHSLSDIVVVRLCENAITEKVFARGDAIFYQGEMGHSLYFLSNGLGIYKKESGSQNEWKLNNVHMCEVNDDDVLCEATLWCTCWVHRGRLHGKTEIKLLTINGAGFQRVVVTSSTVASYVRTYTTNYMNWLNARSHDDLTDVSNVYDDREQTLSFLPAWVRGASSKAQHHKQSVFSMGNALRYSTMMHVFGKVGHHSRHPSTRNGSLVSQDSAARISRMSKRSSAGTEASATRSARTSAIGASVTGASNTNQPFDNPPRITEESMTACLSKTLQLPQ